MACKDPKYSRVIPHTCDGAGYISKDGQSLISNILLSDNEPKKILKSLDNSNHIILHHYSWYSLPRKWEMKIMWHYFWGILNGEYESVEDYQNSLNVDEEPVDLFGPVQCKSPSSYMDAITNEMKNKTIISGDKIPHPEVVIDWVNKQRVYIPKNIRKFRFKSEILNMQSNRSILLGE